MPLPSTAAPRFDLLELACLGCGRRTPRRAVTPWRLLLLLWSAALFVVGFGAALLGLFMLVVVPILAPLALGTLPPLVERAREREGCPACGRALVPAPAQGLAVGVDCVA